MAELPFPDDNSTTKHQTNNSRPKRPQKQPSNPLQKGISEYIATLAKSLLTQHGTSPSELISSLPKRYTIYEPMLLLPLNAFTHPPPWGALYESLDNGQRNALYASIAKAFSCFGVTHIAMNAPIVLTDTQGHENRMRSPAGLIPLYGDFGSGVRSSGSLEDEQPSNEDYAKAFWVRTVQNHGIVQMWAPLYTMFSRGNITEKARILGHGVVFEGLDEGSLGSGVSLNDVAVVDMYAGIGYFVFSYLKRGVKRVWGWEINGWSVEGLRRGCVENGWRCRVIRVQNDGSLSMPISELVENLRDEDRVVIFHGDNGFAARVMGELRAVMQGRQAWTSIRHVNLGLLPTSEGAWDDACRIVDKDKGGWIHVHENVDVQQIEVKGGDIVASLGRTWAEYASVPADMKTHIECRHVEQVKTYAPGVMHCVYDVKLSYNQESESNPF
ncbi:tRNA(Phe) (4-demethylwyosine(37)-C(7)) aminocarboxypropyltransferase [Aspergillus stella-maris]|uniref:tRNA(Phe) (4-demethylwyosine(37)-C(7)) aminocarboxypropyltransferase n=1 Tax=Aspergillus stella-maris TaxID=1810926 RepID=UPI003CCCB9E2